MASLRPCSGTTATSSGRPSASPAVHTRLSRHLGRCRPCAAYNVDTEAERAKAPNAGPGRYSAPPPPPPPPSQGPGLQGPSRRELLFAFLGAGVGVGGSSLYYNSQEELRDEEVFELLDRLYDPLLKDPELRREVADEVLMDEMMDRVDGQAEAMEGMAELASKMEEVAAELEKAEKELGAGSK